MFCVSFSLELVADVTMTELLSVHVWWPFAHYNL